MTSNLKNAKNLNGETTVPVFIGITQKAKNGEESLMNKPVRITSIAEYVTYFGGAPATKFTITTDSERKPDTETEFRVYDNDCRTGLKATLNGTRYTLYYSMILFFANGGGTCYVISVGSYNKTLSEIYRGSKDLILDKIRNEPDINLLVIPEAVNVEECMDIYNDLLNNLCDSGKYFAILDIPNKKQEEDNSAPEDIFRNVVSINNLRFAAAYYPWLETLILSDNDIDEKVLVWDYTKEADSSFFSGNEKLDLYIGECMTKLAGRNGVETDDIKQIKKTLHDRLSREWPLYNILAIKVKDYLNLFPPSAAIAGLYCATDKAYGIWKSTAQIALSCVKNPKECVDHERQTYLNSPVQGKSINVIRAFPGEGTKVLNALTLDGNSPDCRYVNVCRTTIFIRQTIKDIAYTYASGPNDAVTWGRIKCLINNFLHDIWKRGGLAGALQEEAYSIHIGLCETMTDDDILKGIMRITVMIAASHPAEFMEITVEQKMQPVNPC